MGKKGKGTGSFGASALRPFSNPALLHSGSFNHQFALQQRFDADSSTSPDLVPGHRDFAHAEPMAQQYRVIDPYISNHAASELHR